MVVKNICAFVQDPSRQECTNKLEGFVSGLIKSAGVVSAFGELDLHGCGELSLREWGKGWSFWNLQLVDSGRYFFDGE